MIDLIEVINSSGNKYSLSSVSVNPENVSMVRSDRAMKMNLAEGNLPEGLDSRAEFCTIIVDGQQLTVVGSKTEIDKKLVQRKKILHG